ncbi:uncharacterized protein EV420DRAFT_1727579 [Desarmillaria tabescens]|uniref:Uncharacterized protein n=1 Tax=Armillaria tabescens TaxID=1929756 RepID=A0AA39JH29_ARMTA|nr:uncharacterized protein EV420DRAFT_1727579 [Desarmillaria tabescens]KAK0442304.1 hypothetical protein EV420DRAFT_1727579 [Desarmillaria tabescens]
MVQRFSNSALLLGFTWPWAIQKRVPAVVPLYPSKRVKVNGEVASIARRRRTPINANRESQGKTWFLNECGIRMKATPNSFLIVSHNVVGLATGTVVKTHTVPFLLTRKASNHPHSRWPILY